MDPRALDAPEVLDALRVACTSVRAACDPTLLELARRRIAMLLHDDAELAAPSWGPLSDDQVDALGSWVSSEVFDDRQKGALALTEQFVIDVTGVLAGPLAQSAGALGAEIGPFVQGLYLLDVGQRIGMVLGSLVGESIASESWAWGSSAEIPEDPMVAIMAMLAATGRLQSVDPVTKELVRLRGARLHQCRRCQSVRSVAALNTGADDALFDSDDPATVSELSEGTIAALDLVYVTFVGQPSLGPELIGRLTESFDRRQIVELVSYLMRNACNKIPVAFGVDDAIVDDGFEYQIIDATGETITVDESALQR